MVVILESIHEKKSHNIKYERKGHRTFHLSIYEALCFLSDNGGCLSHYKIYTGCKLNFSKLNEVIDFCVKKGFVTDIKNIESNKKIIKLISNRYPTVNTVNTRRIIILTEKGLKFISDYTDYFEELEHIFAKTMPKSR